MRIKKKLALLLSAAMLVTSVNVTPLTTFAACSANKGYEGRNASSSTKLTLVIANDTATDPAMGSTKLTLDLSANKGCEGRNASSSTKLTLVIANHNCEYTVGTGADANKLTAKCSLTEHLSDDCHTTGVSLTLSASSANYSGSTTGWCLAENVAIELEGSSDWENTVGDLPTIHYAGTTAEGVAYSSDTKPDQDGSYTASIVCDEAKAELSFEVGHVFDKIIKAENLASAADYASPAKYYYSCKVCESKGTETFTDGNKLQLATPKLSTPVINEKSIVVKWESVTDAVRYRVFRKNDEGTWVRVKDVTTNSYEDENVESGKSYTYTVRCVSADGKTYMSAYNKTGVTATYCSVPVLKSATATAEGVQVVWDEVTGASGYVVYRKTSGGSWKVIGNTKEVTFTDTAVKSGTEYIYTVRCLAEDDTTRISTYDKNGVSVIFCSAPVLKSIAVNNDGIKVTWKAVTGASGYVVYRRTSGGSWKVIGNTTEVSFTDTTAESGTKYIYTVRCLAEDGKTRISGYDKTGIAVMYCAMPKITVVSNTSDGVNVIWGAVKGSPKYRIYRKVSGGSWTNIAETTSTSYVDTTAVKGTKYAYTVRCLDSDGKTLLSGYDSTGKTITFK